MKKVITILSALFISFIASSSFATMKVMGNNNPQVGKEFVGRIIAAAYRVENNTPVLRVVTQTDKTFKNENQVNGMAIEFTDKDLQMGMAVAANVGKGVAVMIDPNGNIDTLTLITHEYWGPK